MWTYVFNSPGRVSRSGTAGSYGNSKFTFLRNRWTVSKAAALFYIPVSSVWNSIFFTSLLMVVTIFLKNYYRHASRCVKWYHCGFDFCFPNDWWYWVSSVLLLGHFCIFRERFVQILCPLSNWVIYLFIAELNCKSFYIPYMMMVFIRSTKKLIWFYLFLLLSVDI